MSGTFAINPFDQRGSGPAAAFLEARLASSPRSAENWQPVSPGRLAKGVSNAWITPAWGLVRPDRHAGIWDRDWDWASEQDSLTIVHDRTELPSIVAEA